MTHTWSVKQVRAPVLMRRAVSSKPALILDAFMQSRSFQEMPCQQAITLPILMVAALYLIRSVEPSLISETSITSATSVLRSRGYLAEDRYVTTPDGYILNLVRATNPLINNGISGSPDKEPILLIHGVTSNCNSFVVNSDFAKPMNYADKDTSSMSDQDWQQLVASDGSGKSIACLALNFGHEVWLLNRRGTSTSLGHTDIDRQAFRSFSTRGGRALTGQQGLLGLANLLLATRPRERMVNPNYWDFSLDVQAGVDLPLTIDYILDQTGRVRLSTIAFSSGGSLVLMLLSQKPEFAEKISKAALWAPAIRFESRRTSFVAQISAAAFGSYVGPLPIQELDPILRNTIATICQPSIFRRILCNGLSDLLAGRVGDQQVLPKQIEIVLDSSSSGEVRQLLQAEISGTMHYFDYNNRTKNMIVYGQPTPPVYDVSRIEHAKIALWGGVSDTQVPISTLESLVRDMTIPVERHYLDKNGLRFNHHSFIYHRDIAQLLNIPTLRFIEAL